MQHTPKIAHSWDHLKVPVHLGSWSSGHGLSEGARLGAATESLRSTISTAIYIIVYWLCIATVGICHVGLPPSMHADTVAVWQEVVLFQDMQAA